MKSLLTLLFFLPLAFCSAKQNETQLQIEKAVETYFQEHEITGMAVSVIGRENQQKFQQIVTKGNLSKKSSIPVNKFTEFRLGPLTQIFTAAVLAYFVKEGQVSLSDPVSKFLPKSMKVPTYNGKSITLGDLATHTSGLPEMPYSLSSRASFSVNQMYRFLSKYELKREPGTKYEYSYFGYAFLSNLLSRLAKRSYPDLVKQIILSPLGMKDTTYNLSQEQKTRYVTGYHQGKELSPLFNEKVYSVFIGGGGLYSTAQDMLLFLSYNLGKERTSLNALLPLMQSPYHTFKNFQLGLGWKIIPYGSSKLFCHSGTLLGFATYMALVPEENMGVVIFSNQGDISVSSLGEQILNLLTFPLK